MKRNNNKARSGCLFLRRALAFVIVAIAFSLVIADTAKSHDTNTEMSIASQSGSEQNRPEATVVAAAQETPEVVVHTVSAELICTVNYEEKDVSTGPEPSEQEDIDTEAEDEILYYTEEDVLALAQMGEGEAGGIPSDMEVAATMWSACNRLDSGDPYYAGLESIKDIVAQPYQYHGYNPDRVPSERLMALARDVLSRWNAEKNGATDVGRVLPREYMFFHGDGWHNYFTTVPGGYDVYDWYLGSPYES